MTERGWPLLRPTVVSSITGMLLACQPIRPPVILSIPRWTAFIVFRAKSLGMARGYRRYLEIDQIDVDAPSVGAGGTVGAEHVQVEGIHLSVERLEYGMVR